MNTLKVRDLVNVGVFTVIYFIVTYATGMLGMFGPWMIPIAGAFALLLNGIVIMLYLSRVPKFGALTITGLLIGIVMSVGHSYWTIQSGPGKNPRTAPRAACLRRIQRVGRKPAHTSFLRCRLVLL